jgi:hypothetical protein
MAISTLRSLIPGQTWLTGTVAPQPNVGYLTQFYLNTLTGEVYQKTAIDVWTLRGDLTPTEISELTILPSGTGSGDTGEIKFKELLANGDNQIALKAPDSIPATYDFVLPETPGTAGFALTTDGTGKMSWSSGSSLAPVTSVNTKTGDVVLSTTDIGEGTNKYFTDARAQTAAVIDSTADSETNKAASVRASKQFTTDAVAAEASARELADTSLQTNIDLEAAARQAEDAILQNNINTESSARQAADSNIQSILSTEITARENADITLQANITNETTARQNADILLQGNIDSEATARIAADETLQANINAEAATRLAADNALQTDINNQVATETSNRIAADTNLQANIDTEAAARLAADTTLQTNIDAEAAARLAADTTLQANIDAEAAARAAADALLIPLAQKGLPDGVATLDSTGLIPAAQIPFTAAPVQSVNTKTGDVVLATDDIAEGETNKYFTDARAKQAVVLDVTTGLETDQAPSVHAMKEYVTNSVATETAAREAADALLIPLSQKGVADGVATLDATGKVPAEQIPPTAITSVTVVATIAERDALIPQEGDFCVVTDVNETFVYNGAEWIELQVGSAVISVAGKTGAVSLSTNDIAEGDSLYFTDARAKTAAVINSSAGNQEDQAMSVAAAKMFTTDAVQVETAAREAADALLIPLSQKGAPFGVAVLDADGKIDVGNIPGAASELGTPTRGTYAGGLLAFTPDTSIADAADETNLILAKLAPSKPPNLSTKTISLTTSYSAKEAGTNTLRSVVTDVLKPQISTVSTFYNGDSGTLSAEIDATVAGSIVLTPASEAGTYGALVVTSDVDFYAGQAGKEGFWRALSAYIASTTNLSYGAHTYQMKHSETGNTNLLSFYVDNPATATVSIQSTGLPSTASYVSGVPTLSAGSQISFSFSINSAVGKFFNATKVADISSSNTSTANIAPNAAGYAENAVIAVTNAAVTVNSSTYTESLSVSIRGYNSKSVAGTANVPSYPTRIDTVSNESSRKVSGSGQYPATGYGGTYDSTKSLKTDYSEELQMLNGSYQRPASVNYSSNFPVAGPDYSTGMGTGDRWVTFVHGSTLSNASSFTLTINGSSGSWSGAQTAGVKIYAKVEGVTGWIDCNASYPGVGSPSNNGDPAMVFGSSSATSKRVTFGSTTRSGTLYIRIGLPSGSDKKFTSITVGSIV